MENVKVFFQKHANSIIFFLILGVVIGGVTWQRFRFYQTSHYLKTMTPQSIIHFRIYPKVSQPSGVYKDFAYPDPIVTEFLEATRDIRTYWGGGYTVESQDDGWFVEISDTHHTIHMSGTMTSQKGDRVIGTFEKPFPSGGINHGIYQSYLLYQWMKTYRSQWEP